MKKKQKKKAAASKKKKSQNQIHIVVTRNFKETADEFFAYCQANDLNASQAIRTAMKDWLARQKEKDSKIAIMEKRERSMKRVARAYEERIISERR